jgi:hypothetical protein
MPKFLAKRMSRVNIAVNSKDCFFATKLKNHSFYNSILIGSLAGSCFWNEIRKHVKNSRFVEI